MAKKDKQKQEKKEEIKLIRKVRQSTQKTIPIKDITNNAIITEDKNIVKVVEVYPIPFSNLKPMQQNITRQNFENLFKVMPDKFQIKCVSTPANLESQISDLQKNAEKETSQDKLRLTNEYLNSLVNAQRNTVERRFYIAFTDDKTKNNKVEDIEKNLSRLNSKTLQLKSALNNCGNGSKELTNPDLAKLMFSLYNRNATQSFTSHYTKIYETYQKEFRDKNNFYIPPTDYIAPLSIYFTDKKYLAIKANSDQPANDRFYTFLYITSNGYPERMYCGEMDLFVSSFEGVDIDIFFSKKDDRKTKENLRRTIGHTAGDAMDAKSDATDSAYNITSKMQSSYFILNCIQQGQSVYDTSILITVSGNSIEEVNYKAETIIEESKRYDFKIRDLRYQEELALNSSLPLNNLSKKIEKKAKRNMPRFTASGLYPFTAFQLIHDGGLYIANAVANQSPVIPNFWNTSVFNNPHISLFGSSGSGKTSSLELIAIHANVMNIPIFIISPQKSDDFKRLCQYLKGQWIEFGEGTQTRMNIMEIFPLDEAAVNESETIYGDLGKKTKSQMKQKLGVITDFIHSHYTEMNRAEISILGDAIMMAYHKKGITEDNDSLWADEAHTHYKEMPILEDVLEALYEINNPEAKNLILEMKFYVTGVGSFFNGQTNISVDNNFFVVSLENNSKETKPLSVFLAEEFCQSKIRGDKNKKFFMIDEMWDLLEKNNGHESLSGQKLAADAKLLRYVNCSCIFGSQQLSDCLNCESGQIIVKNCDTKILMKHNEEDVKYISQFIDLTSQEKKDIQTFMPGQGLFLANQNRIQIQMSPTDFESLIIFNDKKTLERYELYLKNKRHQEQEEERIKNIIDSAKPLEDLQSGTNNSDIKESFNKFFN